MMIGRTGRPGAGGSLGKNSTVQGDSLTVPLGCGVSFLNSSRV